MKILLVGPVAFFDELKSCVPDTVDVQHSHQPVDTDTAYHVVFDALFDERHELPETFIYPTTHLLVGSSVKRTLEESKNRLKKHIAAPVAGINLLPSFIKSNVKEFAAHDDDAVKRLSSLALMWNWQLKKITDAVGMVTPRVLAMVINEAAHTLEEGTATKEDIDRGMELGTGYAQGPLKWCDKIGIDHVTDVLQALHESTGDARYVTAPLLLRMRRHRGLFY
ncbi:MAG TPA: 3-hydroxyacyl-CoA dehydrogenase family protein [Chitinophagales bacterium]|nr:3-hydroxyacyl-CoA dehydrogenase family protein [Chitinophagales bacterium]